MKKYILRSLGLFVLINFLIQPIYAQKKRIH